MRIMLATALCSAALSWGAGVAAEAGGRWLCAGANTVRNAKSAALMQASRGEWGWVEGEDIENS